MTSPDAGAPKDLYHTDRNEAYLRLLEGEAAYWDKPQPFDFLTLEFPVIIPYMNERFTGDPAKAWFETIPQYGAFTHGCALGTGAMKHEATILEQNPALHLTFYDISPHSLEIREREFATRFPGRVAFEQADINFIELPAERFDVIISYACLHHLLNQEHLAFQVNRALTQDGYFFLWDYAGETKFQFTEEKKQVFEDALNQLRRKHRILRGWHPVWSEVDDWDAFSPFEAIRSEETVDILDRYMNRQSMRAGGGVLMTMLWLRPADAAPASVLPCVPRSLPQRALSFVGGRVAKMRRTPPPDLLRVIATVAPDLVALDRQHADAGTLLPFLVFAVYRKRT